jgi:predicted metal-dependent hydrolase
MQHSITIGNGAEALEVIIKRSLRASRISIKISANEVQLVLPKRADFDRAKQFLLSKELWIRNKLRSSRTTTDTNINIFGIAHEIILNDINIKQPIEFRDNKIIISHVIAADKINNLIQFHLKKMFKTEIEKYIKEKATELGLKYQKITVRDTSTRWGSCSSTGSLSFSWRLILAPKMVMVYVVIHELCHLSEMNHSHRFWRLVEQYFPEHKEARFWLKKHGRSLHNIFS